MTLIRVFVTIAFASAILTAPARAATNTTRVYLTDECLSQREIDIDEVDDKDAIATVVIPILLAAAQPVVNHIIGKIYSHLEEYFNDNIDPKIRMRDGAVHDYLLEYRNPRASLDKGEPNAPSISSRFNCINIVTGIFSEENADVDDDGIIRFENKSDAEAYNKLVAILKENSGQADYGDIFGKSLKELLNRNNINIKNISMYHEIKIEFSGDYTAYKAYRNVFYIGYYFTEREGSASTAISVTLSGPGKEKRDAEQYSIFAFENGTQSPGTVLHSGDFGKSEAVQKEGWFLVPVGTAHNLDFYDAILRGRPPQTEAGDKEKDDRNIVKIVPIKITASVIEGDQDQAVKDIVELINGKVIPAAREATQRSVWKWILDILGVDD